MPLEVIYIARFQNSWNRLITLVSRFRSLSGAYNNPSAVQWNIDCETRLGEELSRFCVLLCVCTVVCVGVGLDNGQLLDKEVLQNP